MSTPKKIIDAIHKAWKDKQMHKKWLFHDCKAAPDHGCQGCLEYMDYFGIHDPEEPSWYEDGPEVAEALGY